MGHKEICTFLRDTKIPRRLFEDKVSAELNSSPAAGVKKRYSANTDSMSKKEKRKSTKSCSLSWTFNCIDHLKIVSKLMLAS